MARHLVRMNAFDPLVSIEPGAQAGIRGWAVGAAIIARLKEAGLSGGIDVLAILGPAISDLGNQNWKNWPGNYLGRLWTLRMPSISSGRAYQFSTS